MAESPAEVRSSFFFFEFCALRTSEALECWSSRSASDPDASKRCLRLGLWNEMVWPRVRYRRLMWKITFPPRVPGEAPLPKATLQMESFYLSSANFYGSLKNGFRMEHLDFKFKI